MFGGSNYRAAPRCHLTRKEPDKSSIHKLLQKRKAMSNDEFIGHTLSLSQTWPLCLLRIREAEHAEALVQRKRLRGQDVGHDLLGEGGGNHGDQEHGHGNLHGHGHLHGHGVVHGDLGGDEMHGHGELHGMHGGEGHGHGDLNGDGEVQGAVGGDQAANDPSNDDLAVDTEGDSEGEHDSGDDLHAFLRNRGLQGEDKEVGKAPFCGLISAYWHRYNMAVTMHKNP